MIRRRASVSVLLAAAFAVGSAAGVTASYHRSFSNGYPSEADGRTSGVSTSTKAQAKSRYESILLAMLPADKVNAAAGFFGPVTKKYLPTFQKFSQEYATSTEKKQVLKKFLPTAERALADAKAMKVPAKYEQEKAEYIALFETAFAATKFMVN